MATIVHERVSSLSSSRQFVPRIGLIRLSSGYVAREAAPAARSLRRRMEWIRRAVGVVTLAVPLAFLIHFLVLGGGIDAYTYQGTLTQKAVDLIVQPVLAGAAWASLPRPVYKGCDLLVAGLCLFTLVVHFMLVHCLRPLDGSAYAPTKRRAGPRGRTSVLGVPLNTRPASACSAEPCGEEPPAQASGRSPAIFWTTGKEGG